MLPPVGKVNNIGQDALRTRFGRGVDLEAVHEFGEIAFKKVGLGVQRDGRVAVSELLLDGFDVGAGGSHQGRAGVAEVVGCDVCEVLASSRAGRVPNSPPGVCVAEWPTQRSGEDEGFWIVLHYPEMRGEHLGDEGGKVHGACLMRLGGSEHEPPGDLGCRFGDLDLAA